MKKIFTSILLLLFISSCTSQDIISEEQKKDFLIEAQAFGEFSGETFLEKTGKLSSSQNINLSSQANGRVTNIYVKEGEQVKKGDILARLEDNIGNYGLNLERAKNGLDRSEINYDSTKINLDKSVFESENTLDKLIKNLQALKDNTKQNIKLAENDLNNTDYTNIDSKSSLELQKLDNAIEKAELDYKNKLIADEETVNSMYNSLKKEYLSSMIFMDDIIKFADELLGITNINKDKNNAFEDFLGAKDVGEKNNAESLLRKLISYRQTDFLNINIDNINTQDGVIISLGEIEKSYTLSRDLLNSIESTLNNSIESVGSLSSTDISNYIIKVNTYQANVQGNYTAFLAFDTSSKSFLKTYLNSQDSILKSLELMKKDREILKKSLTIGGESAEIGYNKTIISSNDSIDSLELQIKSLQNTLENSIKTRDVTLRSLDNAIKEARISYEQALKEYNKLTITSPISGVISSKNIDIGQELNIGTPVFEIKNNNSNEVTISFNKKELDFIETGKEVYVDFEGKTSTGTIYSISQVADSNLKYISNVLITDDLNLIGNIVSVRIPIKTSKILLPINIVKINNSGIGTINILENGEIKQLDLTLGNIYGDKIQILDEFDKNIQVITSYIDNFDSEKFILKVK